MKEPGHLEFWCRNRVASVGVVVALQLWEEAICRPRGVTWWLKGNDPSPTALSGNLASETRAPHSDGPVCPVLPRESLLRGQGGCHQAPMPQRDWALQSAALRPSFSMGFLPLPLLMAGT